MNQLKIKELKATALTNPDVDRQYMAARDMCDDVTRYYESKQYDEPSDKLLEEVLNVYVQQLASPYKDIQGNAIRCISQLNPFLQGKQVLQLAPTLLNLLIKDDPNPNRDNYLICLQDLVDKVPVKIKLQKQKLVALKQSKQANIHQETQQRATLLSDLLRILQSMLNKWSETYTQKAIFDAVEFGRLLLDNILNQDDRSIRKQSCICLGALGHCLTQTQLNEQLHQLYLPQLKQNAFVFDGPGFQQNLHLTQGISLLARSVSAKFDERNIQTLLALILEQVAKKDEFDIDLASQVAEVLESQVLTLDNLYQHHGKVLQSALPELIDSAVRLLAFDPMGIATYDTDDIEFDDDYYVEDVSDSTWRARRSGALLLQTLLRLTPTEYSRIVNACFKEDEQAVLHRLNEKNDEVRIAILNLLCTFIQCSVIRVVSSGMEEEGGPQIQRRPSSQDVDIEGLLNRINLKVGELFSKVDLSQSVKGEAIKLLNLVFANFIGTLQANESNFTVVVAILRQILTGPKQTYNNEQRVRRQRKFQQISAIKNLKELFKAPKRYDHYLTFDALPLLIPFLQDDYIRIVVEALRAINAVLSSLTSYYYDVIGHYTAHIHTIKRFFISQVQVDNLDQEIKSEILGSVSRLLAKLPSFLTDEDLAVVTEILWLRLKGDQLTVPVLRLLESVNPKQLVQKFVVDIINGVSISILKQDKQVKLLALRSINNLLGTQVQLPLALVNDLIVKSRQQISLGDQYLVEQVFKLVNQLMQSYQPSSSEIHTLCQEALTYVLGLPNLPADLIQFFTAASSHKLITVDQAIKFYIEREMRREALLVAGSVVANIVLGEGTGAQQRVTAWFGILAKSPINAEYQLILATLRVLLRTTETDQWGFLAQRIESRQEPELHALVLASVCIQNLGANLPRLQQLIQGSNEAYYLVALNDVVDHLDEQISLDIARFCLDQARNRDRNLQRTISGVLGKVCQAYLPQMVQLLLTSLKDPAHSVRFTSASAAKYCFQSSNNHPQVVALLLEALVHILGLEQDIDILIAVVKAITTSFYHSSGSHVQFLPSLSASALRRFEIRELDFGNFKEKRDDAKDLRSLGFHLVEIAIDRGHGLDLQIGACLDEVIANFVEDKFDETRIPRLRILNKIAASHPQELAVKEESLLRLFEPTLKEFSTVIQREKAAAQKDKDKASSVLEKDREKIRLLLQSAQLFAKAVPQSATVQSFYQQRVVGDKAFEGFM